MTAATTLAVLAAGASAPAWADGHGALEALEKVEMDPASYWRCTAETEEDLPVVGRARIYKDSNSVWVLESESVATIDDDSYTNRSRSVGSVAQNAQGEITLTFANFSYSYAEDLPSNYTWSDPSENVNVLKIKSRANGAGKTYYLEGTHTDERHTNPIICEVAQG